LKADNTVFLKTPISHQKPHVQRYPSRVEEVLCTESLVRKAILEGVDPKEAYLRHGKF